MQLYNETTNKQRQTDRKTVHYNRAKNAGILRDKTLNNKFNKCTQIFKTTNKIL